MKALRTPFFLQEIEDFGFADEFVGNPDTTNRFALTAPNSGTATVSGVGGILALTPSGGSPAANDEAYLASKNPLFQPLAGQPIYAEALVQFKLELLLKEIGQVGQDTCWPTPCDTVLDFVSSLRMQGSEVAIISSGHEMFIKRCFQMWNRPVPL